MKKWITAIVLITLLAGCGTQTPTLETTTEQTIPEITVNTEIPVISDADFETEKTENAKALVVYFSATGTTKAAAETLAEMQNADLFEILPAQPYTAEDLNYNDRSTRATAEQNDPDARPAISNHVENIADYDIIYLGFPIWWADMPRICYTFLESYDFVGKTIAPFCTSGGSGISQAVRNIAALAPNAAVTEGLKVGGNAEQQFSVWLEQISHTEG